MWEDVAARLQGIIRTGRIHADFESSLIRKVCCDNWISDMFNGEMHFKFEVLYHFC